jgi:tetratricopeptide (TPR) repeat protein
MEMLARARQTVEPMRDGADIDATITAARDKLGRLDTAGARSVLATKIAAEDTARRQRLVPLLEEQATIERLSYDYEAAKATLRQLLALEPERVWGWIDLGDLFVTTGNLNQADEAYRQARAIADRLAKADPGNAGWQRDLSVSFDKVGNVLEAQGNLPEALKSYRDSLAIRDRLAKSDPGNARWQRDLATSHERLGDIYLQQKKREEARQAFEQALGVYGLLMARNPGDVQSQVFSVVPRWRLASLDPLKGRDHLRAALAILKPLAETNRLDANRLKWIPQMEAQLANLEK